jgi:hypothetical protein
MGFWHGHAQRGRIRHWSSKPEVCEVDVQGRRVNVRDEGVLKLVGNALCQAMQQQHASARTPGTA